MEIAEFKLFFLLLEPDLLILLGDIYILLIFVFSRKSKILFISAFVCFFRNMYFVFSLYELKMYFLRLKVWTFTEYMTGCF